MDTSLRKFYPWFTVLGLLVSGLVVAAYYKDQFREWKTWQREYIKDELARASIPTQKAAAARIQVEVRQIILPELNRVDRCTSCHVTVEEDRKSTRLNSSHLGISYAV